MSLPIEKIRAFGKFNREFYSYGKKNRVQQGIHGAHEGKAEAPNYLNDSDTRDYKLGVKIYKEVN